MDGFHVFAKHRKNFRESELSKQKWGPQNILIGVASSAHAS